jgi:hypothetical protein
MALAAFLAALFEDGRVRVASIGTFAEEELREATAVLRHHEAEYRLHLPGDPPPFVPEAAAWGAGLFYRACQFAAFRDVDASIVAEALASPCPPGNLPAIHYNVDLTFRFLPDLVRLARGLSVDDPLVERLMTWGAQWPLSSVGTPGVQSGPIDGFAGSPSLMGLYVDRVLARKDLARLGDPRVREAVRGALGLFELAPEAAALLEKTDTLNESNESKEAP